MLDAARLASPVGEGILWHPSSLEDIYAVPARTLWLFDYYRLGAASAAEPWTWWRLKAKRTTAHQYQMDWKMKPGGRARCGYDPDGAALERSDAAHCKKCAKLDKGEPEEPTGTVAGVRVGASQREGRGQRQEAHA
jgi:hypothetical protein